MGLALYKKKRDFRSTAEPEGKTKKTGGTLIFVVQKHDATRLHYDFRLEMEGVLKSWAVPKGPSLNPEDRRLAVEVEDHPFDYKDFEGVIAEGNYGAGNVIVWDNGTYHALHTEDAEESEKELLEGLKKGHITFILHGKKLKGEFALVRLHGSESKNNWLLIKKRDEYASEVDVLKKEKSILSGKTVENIGKNPRKKAAPKKRKTADGGTKK
jgi:bifunctional non-homologous end joining protein LigD